MIPGMGRGKQSKKKKKISMELESMKLEFYWKKTEENRAKPRKKIFHWNSSSTGKNRGKQSNPIRPL